MGAAYWRDVARDMGKIRDEMLVGHARDRDKVQARCRKGAGEVLAESPVQIGNEAGAALPTFQALTLPE